MTEIAAQLVGIIAMAFNIGSFQCKKNKNLLLALGTGSLLFSVNYVLLGAFASAGFNMMNILRSAFAINKKLIIIYFLLLYVYYIYR